MNICIIIDKFHPLFTGAGQRIELLWEVLGKQGLKGIVVTRGNNKLPKFEHYKDFEINRIKPYTKTIKKDPLYELKVFYFLLQNREDIDIIQIVGIPKGILGSILFAKLFGKKVIHDSVLLGADDAMANKPSPLRFWLYSKMDKYVVMSTPLAESYKESQLPEEKLVLIAGGVDIEKYTKVMNKKKLRKKLNLLETVKIFCYFGSLIKRKGVDILIEAWKEVSKNDPDNFLVLVGRFPTDEPQKTFAENLQRTIIEYGLENRTMFTGFVVNPQEYLQASDIFVFPSRHEGFGLVIIEAMSCELPCIVSELDGISHDIIENEIDGLILKNNVPHELKSAMIYLLENEELCKKLGENARKKVIKKFLNHEKAQSYYDVYKELMKN